MLRASVLCVVLAVLPGAWISFGLALRDLHWSVRIAVAIALSPAVVGLQLVVLKLFDVGFPAAALVILVVNVPGIVLIHRRARGTAGWALTREAGPAVATVGALLITLVVPWLLIENFRVFAWHSLIHTDIVYGLVRTTGLPEDPEVAGVTLAYPWISHAFWAITAWLSDRPPVAIFPLTNVLWIITGATLAYACAAGAFNLGQAAAVASVALTYLAGQVLPFAAQLFAGDGGRWREYFAYRASPLLEKYRGFETMPFGVALVLAIFLLSARGLTREIKHAWALLACLLMSLALVYPLLYPVGLVTAVFHIALLLPGTCLSSRLASKREILLIGAGVVVSLIVFRLALWFYMPSAAGGLPLATGGRQAKGVQAFVSLALLAAAAAPGAFWAVRRRDAPLLLAGLVSASVASAYVLVDAVGLEYKYVTVTAIFMAPIGAKSLELVFTGARSRVAASLVVVALLVIIDLTWFLQLRVNVPVNLSNAPVIQDAGFWLSLDSADPDSMWVKRVRDGTPQDTVVVARNARVHVGPFLQRSLFAPADADGWASAGYSTPTRVHLVDERRYPASLIDGRVKTAEDLVDPPSRTEFAAALHEVQALGRPVAISLSTPSEQVLDWLKALPGGRELWRGPNTVVWLVNPQESVRSSSDVGGPELHAIR